MQESGSLINDLQTSKLIQDPNAVKPHDWVDAPRMLDPNQVDPNPPNTWSTYRDPNDIKPVGAGPGWKPKTIPNPLYIPYDAIYIPNPDFIGFWEPEMIPNPSYIDLKKDATLGLLEDSVWLGIEVWQVKSGTIFNHFVVTDSVEEAESYAQEHFVAMREKELKSKRDIDRLQDEILRGRGVVRSKSHVKPKKSAVPQQKLHTDL